jgi:hypothetical protein
MTSNHLFKFLINLGSCLAFGLALAPVQSFAATSPCASIAALPYSSPYRDLTISCTPDGSRFQVYVNAPWATHAHTVIYQDAKDWFVAHGIDPVTGPVDILSPCDWAPGVGGDLDSVDVSTFVPLAQLNETQTGKGSHRCRRRRRRAVQIGGAVGLQSGSSAT